MKNIPLVIPYFSFSPILILIVRRLKWKFDEQIVSYASKIWLEFFSSYDSFLHILASEFV